MVNPRDKAGNADEEEVCQPSPEWGITGVAPRCLWQSHASRLEVGSLLAAHLLNIWSSKLSTVTGWPVVSML